MESHAEHRDHFGGLDYPGSSWVFKRDVARGNFPRIPAWGMGDVLVSLLGAATFGVVVSLILMLVHIDPANGWGLIVAFAAPWVFLAGWPIASARIKGNKPSVDFGLVRTPQHLRLGLVAGVISLLLGSSAAAISAALFGPISSTAGNVGARQSGLVFLAFVVFALVGAPIVEELAFRGMLYGALCKSQIAPFMSVVISAGIFSLYHLEPGRIFVLFVIGVVLGEVRRRSGSTYASIIAHAVNNAPGIIGLVLTHYSLMGR